MAVRIGVGVGTAAAVAGKQRAAAQQREYYIKYVVDGAIRQARKLDPVDFNPAHIHTLSSARLTHDRKLVFDNPAWRSVWLGAGEEKSVYLIIDEHDRAFALELLVRGGYLQGRLTEGYYLADLRLSHLTGQKRDPKALLSLTYSGEAKAREFIYGETLAGPSHVSLRPQGNSLRRLINNICLSWATYVAMPRYHDLRRTFVDAHEANVAIELIPIHNPERKSHYLFPILALGHDRRLHWHFYRLTPIDVRARAK